MAKEEKGLTVAETRWFIYQKLTLDLGETSAIQFKHVRDMYDKTVRESKWHYKLKRWFLSLRFINNWLWRRGNKKRIYYCLKNECTRDSLGRTDCVSCNWRGYCRDVYPEQNTYLLPDYPSIRELSNERPNVQANQKN